MQPTKSGKPKGSAASHIAHPSSPEPSPDLTKVRTYAACKSCRVKKVKCLPGPTNPEDGTPGRCQQCAQSNAECVYPPTRDRAAYSRQYVQNLEARVQALEGMSGRILPIIEAYEKNNGIVQPEDIAGPSNMTNGIDEAMDSIARVRRDTSEEASDMDDGGQMTQDERGNYRWIGASNTLSLLGSFSNTRSPHEPTPPVTGTVEGGHNPYFGHVAGSGVVKALPGVDEVNYPDPIEAAAMVDAFFKDIHPVLPVLEEKTFREDYRNLMERRAKQQPETVGGFISVVFAVFALGARVLSTSKAWQRERDRLAAGKPFQGHISVQPGEAEAGVIWYERAQILHYTTLKDVNISQVQCLTLLAAFQASVNAMPMSWLLAGQAIRVAQDLGLHRSTARLRISFTEKQIRARCWWAIYGLERLVSSQLGRPLGVDDLDVDVAYPVIIDDQTLSNLPHNQFDAPELGEEPYSSSISGFVALTKLSKIAGRVTQLLYRPSNGRSTSDPTWAASQQNNINKLEKMLKDWLENDVPTKYKDATSTGSVQLVSAVLSNAYFSVRLTLHRNFLPSNPDYARPRPPSNSQSLSILVEAARSSIFTLAQQRVLLPPSHHLAAGCHNLWSSAVILLLCEVQARDQVVVESVASSVDQCRLTLRTLEPAWPGAKKLVDLLNDAEARTKEVSNGSFNPGQRRKRKSATFDSGSAPKRQTPGNMPPPNSIASPRSANQTWWSNNRATPQHSKAYEMSDTRTMVDDDSSHSGASFPPTAQVTPPLSTTTTLGTTIDTSQMFDIGGVTFDGLEMLQGFDFGTTDSTNFWNSFISPTAGGQYVISGQSTPASGNGPSPGSWQMQNTTNDHPMSGGSGLTPGAGGGIMGGQAGIGNSAFGADFWSQVAPGGYDWAADPNVPFNF